MLIRENRSQTKTIVTLGPASSPKEILRKIFYEGVDVLRLNFSHGTHEDKRQVIQSILELNTETQSKVAIMADLQGPKIRIGDIEGGSIDLNEGDQIVLTTKRITGNREKVYLSYQSFPNDVKAGEEILLDDGKMKMRILSSNLKDEVKAEVINGGTLFPRKGVNLPDTKVSLPSLTEKDKADLDFALDHDVDWIALSFVRKAKDVRELREYIAAKGKNTSVIAKIEKPEALKEIDGIIDEADAVMVARGDLGVEISFEKVPLIQKQLIHKCIVKGKPVIVATQMMESMITNFQPTRAETNDVANAVLDGADALMLSGETSVGQYPVDAIRNMQKIIDWTEAYGYDYNRQLDYKDTRRFLSDSICDAARRLSDKAYVKAIIIFTNSGYTAYRMSSFRPKASIFVFTSNKDLLRRMSLVWGVRAFYMDPAKDSDESIMQTLSFLKNHKMIHAGDHIIHLASIPLKAKGQTNMIKLSRVEE